jgi:hypothetical protein
MLRRLGYKYNTAESKKAAAQVAREELKPALFLSVEMVAFVKRKDTEV